MTATDMFLLNNNETGIFLFTSFFSVIHDCKIGESAKNKYQ